MGGEVTRTMDPTHLNAVANHPDVRPWLGGKGELDLSLTLADPQNVALVTDHGGFVCLRKDAGLYDVHSLFLPDRPRRETVDAMRDGLAFMFAETDCVDLVTQVPSNNPAAAGLAALGHFTPRFTQVGVWPAPDGAIDVTWFGLDLWTWTMRAAEPLAAGHIFHAQLEAAKRASGSALVTHADDDTHDRAAGATYLMALAGNAVKAVTFYNRWAVVAGYVPITLVSLQPVILDIGDAVMSMRNRELQVLLCR